MTDDDGLTDSYSTTVTVSPPLKLPPVANFTYAASGLTVTFNASSSYDPDGSIVSYAWDFGDGANTTGEVVSHTYSRPGNYTVTLTVTDDDGLTATTSKTIRVQPSSDKKEQLKQQILTLILKYMLTRDAQLKQQILQMILEYMAS